MSSKKNKIDFFDLIQKDDFNVKSEKNQDGGDHQGNSNILLVDDNIGSLKKLKKAKTYEYKKVFDKSLDEHKKIKKTALVYQYNMDKISVLSALNKDLNLMEILNYIVHDFFVRNSEEIKEEYKIMSADLNKNL